LFIPKNKNDAYVFQHLVSLRLQVTVAIER
jgi:hypothetical protein